MNDPTPLKTVEKSVNIILALNRSEGMSFPDLADEFEMPTSTIHDYVQTLESLELIVKDNDEYRVSTRFLGIGIRAREQMEIFQVAGPQVQELAQNTEEHAALMIEEHDVGVLLYISQGQNALDLGVTTGFRMALPTNAPGKAILANLSRERVERILDKHGLPKITKNTITEREELFKELSEIRERGFATDNEERAEGVRAVAAPIVPADNVQGALAISGPAHRMEGEWFDEELPDILLKATNVVEIKHTLGG